MGPTTFHLRLRLIVLTFPAPAVCKQYGCMSSMFQIHLADESPVQPREPEGERTSVQGHAEGGQGRYEPTQTCRPSLVPPIARRSWQAHQWNNGILFREQLKALGIPEP